MSNVDFSGMFSEDTRNFFRSPVRDIFKRVDLNKIYSFAGGYPSADTFPLDTFGDIMQRVLEREGAAAFQYGATQGVTKLREAISKRYGVPVANVQITSSSQQGIDVCTRVLVDPGDVTLAFNPTYLGALQSFRSYRADVVGVAAKSDIDDFEKEWRKTIEKCLSDGKKIKFLYAVADFQNPSGETLTLEQRKVLVKLAAEYGFIIIEDAPYRELRYEGSDIPTLYSLDPEHVAHLGSFSKIMAPGFRLGWIIANEQILDRIYVCKQALDLCPPVFDQYVAEEFLSSGALDANLKKSVELYRSKRDLMLRTLEEVMPGKVRWTHPDGGLFLFLTLPEGFDAVKFYDKALDAGVAYVAGQFFHTDGVSGKNTMRLNFSFMSHSRIVEGIKLLGKLLDEVL